MFLTLLCLYNYCFSVALLLHTVCHLVQVFFSLTYMNTSMSHNDCEPNCISNTSIPPIAEEVTVGQPAEDFIVTLSSRSTPTSGSTPVDGRSDPDIKAQPYPTFMEKMFATMLQNQEAD